MYLHVNVVIESVLVSFLSSLKLLCLTTLIIEQSIQGNPGGDGPPGQKGDPVCASHLIL